MRYSTTWGQLIAQSEVAEQTAISLRQATLRVFPQAQIVGDEVICFPESPSVESLEQIMSQAPAWSRDA